MGLGAIDDIYKAADKAHRAGIPKAARKVLRREARAAGSRPLTIGKSRTLGGMGARAPYLDSRGLPVAPLGPRASAIPRPPKPSTPRGGGMGGGWTKTGLPKATLPKPPMPGPMHFNPGNLPNPPAPRTGFNKYAHNASQWAKGHKKIVAGAGAVALWGTAMSNSSGPGSPKGNQNQARGMYGF